MSTIQSLPAVLRRPRSSGMIARLARALVHQRLAGIRDGQLAVEDSGGVRRFGEASDLPCASLRVLDPGFYARVALSGSLGFAESFLRGEWTTDDLTNLLSVFARNLSRHGGGRWASAAFARPLARLGHALSANSRRGSRKNIHAHYDLGNAFYALFLDDTMTYSCAVFPERASSLREASVRKLDLVCRKLGLAPGQRVLEIGTGWGSFAIHAAKHYGCHVTTTTISDAQHQLALERIRAEGLTDRIEVLTTDYRDLEGSFDRLVSIEMIEAVGHENLPAYFRACADRLRSDGAMLLQAITMPDRDYDDYLTSADYIQCYVFPGSSLPSLGAITSAVARTDLRIDHLESIGRHYGETLRRWRASFTARLPEIKALGFDDRFVRLWTYYLCYCEAGFEEGYVDDLQLVLAKPAWRGAPIASESANRDLASALSGARA
ncbi:MAG: class I SAM-dependent methyltransferase [Candidatus Eisenbacteria bacterium]|uniref:Class I SAM-dependent methyltransferase n=1 Tax=Eiseniibacteriota bacterium TaxID=2212470 RepID=A0A849SL96_UNCEI|nr:class I SAM-dependent methyltransferase [Candidatus Eisenbacteria bacterium]